MKAFNTVPPRGHTWKLLVITLLFISFTCPCIETPKQASVLVQLRCDFHKIQMCKHIGSRPQEVKANSFITSVV